MNDLMSMLSALHRPRLMMRAARIGAEDYRRSTHLPRLLGDGFPARHGAAILRLLDIESALEEQRVHGDPGYRMVRHLDTLIAIIGEARELNASQQHP